MPAEGLKAFETYLAGAQADYIVPGGAREHDVLGKESGQGKRGSLFSCIWLPQKRGGRCP